MIESCIESCWLSMLVSTTLVTRVLKILYSPFRVDIWRVRSELLIYYLMDWEKYLPFLMRSLCMYKRESRIVILDNVSVFLSNQNAELRKSLYVKVYFSFLFYFYCFYLLYLSSHHFPYCKQVLFRYSNSAISVLKYMCLIAKPVSTHL